MAKRIDFLQIFASDTVAVEGFRQSWLRTLSTPPIVETETQQTTSNDNNDKLNFPDIPEMLMEELERVCSIETLTCEEEPDKYEFATRRLETPEHTVHNIPSNIDLATVRLQEEELKKRWNQRGYLRKLVQNRRKRYDYETQMNSCKKKVSECEEGMEDEVDRSDVVMNVLVCEQSSHYMKKCLRKGGIKYTVLGSQKLTELRDKISCVADIAVPGDFSFDPDAPQDIRSEHIYKSGFFYIDGTFYNDMRDPSCRNYSKIIIDWAENDSSRRMGPFQVKRMETTTFTELDLQLGYPYLYTHQGNCEHIVVFTDLRMISADDCLDRMQYPLFISVRKKRRNVCMLCCILTPRWITRKSDRFPHDPFMFCDNCFRSLNYDDNNQKIGDFLVHPYFDKVATL